MAEERQPSEEELRELLEAELRKLKVADVLAQAVLTVSQLGFMRMGAENRDLAEARLAIDALKALVPVLKDALPDQAVRDFESVIANMQLSYARAAGEVAAKPPVRDSGPVEGVRGNGEVPPAK
jgi:hypothetical protein